MSANTNYQQNAVVVFPSQVFTGSASPYASPGAFSCPNPQGVLTLYVNVSSLSVGQTVTPVIAEIDASGATTYSLPSFNPITVAGQYMYKVGIGQNAYGGSIPSGGAIPLSPPASFVVFLVFGNTGGSEPATVGVGLQVSN